MRATDFTQAEVNLIIRYRAKGLSCAEIGRRIGRSKSGISRKLRRLEFNSAMQVQHLKLQPTEDPELLKAQHFLQRRGYVVFNTDKGYSVDGQILTPAQLLMKAEQVEKNMWLAA